MRELIYILTIILFASCGQISEKRTSNQTTVLTIDTLVSDNIMLTLQNADSFATTDIYGDLNFRTKLTDTIENWHDRAKKIESYLSEKFGNYFYSTDTTLVLTLTDGDTLHFPKWDSDHSEGYNFVHYFDKINYYLLRVQYGEGNSWMLVNRKNGFQYYTIGLPYISKDNKKIVSINSDLEAGYNYNGLELITIHTDSLQMVFLKETEWGPTDVKWINKNQFLLKRERFHIDTIAGTQDNIIDYKQVTIEKKTSQ